MKCAWIEHHRDEYTVSRLCRVLSVSRTGYCQRRVRTPSARALANEALDAQVAAIHRDSRRSYGRPRITQQLRQQGQCVSTERVRRSPKRQGLRPVYRRAYVVTTDSVHRLPVAANILDRRFDDWQPNRAWVADITYIATGEGWLYLAAVMDLASRRIVGWSMSQMIDAKLVCAALRSACWQRKPAAGLLVHTDRGSQGGFNRSSQHLQSWRCYGKTLKVERIYQVRYNTRAQARLDIVDWIEGFYNRVRIHSANGYLAPVTRERSLLTA
jgi:transposase InsO family protein